MAFLPAAAHVASHASFDQTGERLFWPDAAAAELDSGAVSHGTAEYARLMQVKARPTLAALRRGYHVLTTDTDGPLPHSGSPPHHSGSPPPPQVLTTDTDVVFLRDPLAHLRR